MATANPLETPAPAGSRHALIRLLRSYGGGIAWFGLLVAITIASLASGGASLKAVGLGLVYGCAFGFALEWLDRWWHRRTGRELYEWARSSREQAHVAVPFLIMLTVLALLTVQTRAHEGLVATWTFTGIFLVVTMPRHQRQLSLHEGPVVGG